MRARRLVSGLAVTALLLASCGGGDDEGASPDPDVGAPAGDDGGDGPVGAEGNDEFQALLAKSRASTYTVVYLRNGEETITISHEGDVTAVLEEGEDLLIDDGQRMVSCSESECFAFPGGGQLDLMVQGLLGPFAFLFSAETAAGFLGGLNLEVSSDTIAGRDAKCITLDPSVIGTMAGVPSDALIVTCVDEETGVVLKGEFTAESETEGIVAVEFRAEGDPALLTPPFEPTSQG